MDTALDDDDYRLVNLLSTTPGIFVTASIFLSHSTQLLCIFQDKAFVEPNPYEKDYGGDVEAYMNLVSLQADNIAYLLYTSVTTNTNGWANEAPLLCNLMRIDVIRSAVSAGVINLKNAYEIVQILWHNRMDASPPVSKPPTNGGGGGFDWMKFVFGGPTRGDFTYALLQYALFVNCCSVAAYGELQIPGSLPDTHAINNLLLVYLATTGRSYMGRDGLPRQPIGSIVAALGFKGISSFVASIDIGMCTFNKSRELSVLVDSYHRKKEKEDSINKSSISTVTPPPPSISDGADNHNQSYNFSHYINTLSASLGMHTATSIQPTVYILYGPQASGKGSVLELLLKALGKTKEGVVTISVDDVVGLHPMHQVRRRLHKQSTAVVAEIYKYAPVFTSFPLVHRNDRILNTLKRSLDETQDSYQRVRREEGGNEISDMLLDQALLGRKNISWETTGESVSWTMQEIHRWKGLGYSVKLVYPIVSIETAQDRAKDRSIKTGQAASIEKIKATAMNAATNVQQLIPLVDDSYLIWNGGTRAERKILVHATNTRIAGKANSSCSINISSVYGQNMVCNNMEGNFELEQDLFKVLNSSIMAHCIACTY
jgi:predicted ABC-type ATPase